MPKGRRIVRTIRRSDKMAGISLRKRRCWYSDEGNEGDDTQEGDTQSDVQAGIDYDERIAAMERRIAELNRESAERRLAVKEAEEKLEAERRQRLEEQGKWQELAEERQRALERSRLEIERLRPIEQRHSQFIEALAAENDARLQQIPEHNRALVPVEDMSPERLSRYLTDHWLRLTASNVPSTDAGAGGGATRPPTKASDYDRSAASLAARYGYNVDPESIAQRRQSLQNQARDDNDEMR